MMTNKVVLKEIASRAPLKQRGAIMITALVFLALMTIVSFSAAKISSVDTLVSGSNQQAMLLYQKTSRELADHASSGNLVEVLLADNGENNNYLSKWKYTYAEDAENPNSEKVITNRVRKYGCGTFNGLANSQGSNNTCRLFDFEVNTKNDKSSAKDRHVRGGGKEFPSISKNNFNN